MNMQAGSATMSSAHGARDTVALVPRINIQAFCERQQTQDSIQAAFADRRMARAHGSVLSGGIPAAIRLYQTQSTPNLLIVESDAAREALLANLTSLAEVCQPDTKVVVIGHTNDVVLYRELIGRGVSEYIVAPVAPLNLVEAIATLYRSERATPVGRVIAFIGARGGAGSSTMAHNCAWEIARTAEVETTIVDLDLAFGTAALDFNLDASGGIMEAILQPERVDALLLDRLLVKLADRLNLLGGPGGVDKDFTIEPHAVETILTAMRSSVPMIVLDVPNVWAPWVRFTLLHADQIVITAEPDLASLRNARAMVDLLRAARPNDPPPSLVLNKTGIPKRPEISGADFHKAIGSGVVAAIPFDPQSFGDAVNNGRMVLDMSPRAKPAEAIRGLARSLVGERATKAAVAGSSSLLKKLLELGKK